MEKVLRVCDICQTQISIDKCELCGKDLCKDHIRSCYINIYNPRDRYVDNKQLPNNMKIGIGYCGIYMKDKSDMSICEECETKVCNAFNFIKNGNRQTILKELLEVIKEYAKIEAI